MKSARAERREIWPFVRAAGELDHVAFRVNREGKFDSSLSSFELSADPNATDGAHLTVEVQLAVDPKKIAILCDLPSDSVDIVLSVEHPGARTTKVEERWSSKVPKEHAIVLGPADYSVGEVVVRVSAVLARQLDFNDERPWRAGSSLSTKELRIYRPVSSSLFKIENTSFKERDWGGAAWFVDFTDLEGAHEAPPEQVVTVHVNKDLEALQMLLEPSASRRRSAVSIAASMVRGLVFTGILADVTLEVLREFGKKRDEQPDLQPDPGSMVEAVLTSLERVMRVPEADLITLAVDQPMSFRRRVSALKEINRAFGRDSYDALLRGHE